MFELEKSFPFEAAHDLKYHDGKCKRLHGHSYTLTVTLRSQTLITDGPKRNMVMDFEDVNKAVHPLIKEYLDHHHLNETLQNDSPTSEVIAQWTFEQLKKKLPSLYSVSISETPRTKVIYCPEPH